MNLKPFVNDKTLWSDFIQEIDNRIEDVHRQMEQAREIETMYRLQGEVFALRRLKMLREKVNG